MKTNDIRNFVQLPDYFSLANALFGLVSIYFALQGDLFYAYGCMLLSGAMDVLDGRVARAKGIASEFGKQLDSLCDTVSFLVAPAMFAFCSLTHGISWWSAAILLWFVACGILRLARFNLTGTQAGGKEFEGLPVPASLLLPAIVLLLKYVGVSSDLWVLLYALLGLGMISVLRIRKL